MESSFLDVIVIGLRAPGSLLRPMIKLVVLIVAHVDHVKKYVKRSLGIGMTCLFILGEFVCALFLIGS